MQHAERCVNQNFNGEAMPQKVFESMVDGGLNVGCTGLMWFTDKRGHKQRTTIWKNAQAHDWHGVCDRLTDFVNSAGKRSQGLVNRRTDFQAWCRMDAGAQ